MRTWHVGLCCLALLGCSSTVSAVDPYFEIHCQGQRRQAGQQLDEWQRNLDSAQPWLAEEAFQEAITRFSTATMLCFRTTDGGVNPEAHELAQLAHLAPEKRDVVVIRRQFGVVDQGWQQSQVGQVWRGASPRE